LTFSAAVGAPAAAVGDPADLLDVDVDQLAGTVAFVADRGGLGRADHLAGDRVQRRQGRLTGSAQHPGDRAWRHPELGTDPVLAAAMLPPARHDPFLDPPMRALA
jgi:hypothetical protein